MDYAFTDRYLVTPEHATLYCEKLYYLPSLICWTPTSDYLELPPLQPNHTHPDQIILGCGNATFKLNQQVIALWSQILHQLPHAVLHLKSQSFDYQICRSAFEQHFAQHGIDSNRLCLSGGTDIYHHMKFYNQVDIALDPFPYNGGITTCEILWMGVPVVTLGNQSLNRAGASILSQVGHPEWIARDEADYIGLVIELAQQTKKRAQLRTQLRQDMIASPLCDAVGYVREIESAYCYMWQQWCQQKGGGG